MIAWLSTWQAGCIIVLSFFALMALLVCIAFEEGRRQHRNFSTGRDAQ